MKLNNKIIKDILNLPISKQNLNRYLKNHYSHIYKYILKQTLFLDNYDDNISILERLYCILNNFNDRPKCCICNKNYVSGFNKQNFEYKKWCSPKCQASDINCILKSKNTRKTKYGNENYNGIEKSKKTRFLKNNGNWHSDNFSEKVKQTKKQHYNNEFFVNSEKTKRTIKEKLTKDPDFYKKRLIKIQNTNVQNGKDKNWNNREKYQYTCLNKYGVSCYTQTDDWYQKTQRTISSCNDFYKKRNEKSQNTISNIKDFYKRRNEKTIKTNVEKYGKEYFLQTEKCRKLRIDFDIQKKFNFLKNCSNDQPLFGIELLSSNFDNKNYEYEFECLKCHNRFYSTIGNHNGIHKKCNICFKDNSTSNEEQELFEFIEYVDNNTKIRHDRSIVNNLELDIYIPNRKLAIEFDGLYWHSEESGKNKNYHLNKTQLCKDKNIQLIHIFENEWVYKKDIVKSRLKNIFGIYDKTIFARKCQIKEISNKDSRDFQDKNHLQGAINSKVNIGLYYNDQLISLMTFGKCRFDKKHEWEMLRFCNKLGYHIPGGASKLLKYFEKTYKSKSIISYADRRWSQGKLYEKLGFKLDHISQPDYWYFKTSELFLESRIKYQKHKLKNILDKFNESKTEVQNMKDNGYNRIFDCGNLVFVKYFN